METGQRFDFERFKEQTIQKMSEGEKRSSADSVSDPMLKHLLELMLEDELDSHLADSKAAGVSNRRNWEGTYPTFYWEQTWMIRRVVRKLQLGICPQIRSLGDPHRR